VRRIEWYCEAGHVVDSYPDDGRDRVDGEGRPVQYRLPPMVVCPGPWDGERSAWGHECALGLRYRVVSNDRP
jgi:hypothetical protein